MFFHFSTNFSKNLSKNTKDAREQPVPIRHGRQTSKKSCLRMFFSFGWGDFLYPKIKLVTPNE